ncbi:hypothetical protein DFR70_104751 [Nocardia tenerifensis]|uniref:Glycoprotein n=1 Tax=Nocardia tenerifensis TaxID=228006 RepID=A0A318K8B6_9NOCA|nr:DUF6049 family protein [Nocardia tenerifensis]PXX65686.1 hypothetical protein DFR70_104751 [Nocardia tenerifensis]
MSTQGTDAALLRIFLAALVILGSTTLPMLVTPSAQAQPTGTATSTERKFLKLSLDSVTPTAITTTSDPTLTISGSIMNIGDREVKDVTVRAQRGAAIATPRDLRATLQLDQVNYDVNGDFEDVVPQLDKGERTKFTVTIPLRPGGGTDKQTLNITEPGVYPLLLNVNGKPDYGNQARLDDARFLLPVLGVPPPAKTLDAPEANQAVTAPTDAPVATTLLWPLADRPRLVAGVPGSAEGKVELTDDELAASLAKGGRLDQLLGALETVFDATPTRDRALASSVCLAVDPDLLITVQAMTRGYRVLASPSDPDGATRPGTGAAQAQTWLDRLRALAGTMCTVALPFAQVDLDALAAVNDPDLSARAMNAPAELVDSILATKSVRGVSLPDSGSIDKGAGMLLRGHGFTTAVLADSAVTPEGTADPSDTATPTTGRGDSKQQPTATQHAASAESADPDVIRLPAITAAPPSPPATAANPAAPNGNPTATPAVDPALRVATFDIWSATALAALGSNPPTPSFTPAKVRYEVSNDSRVARLQDALGAVSWAALNPQPNQPRSLLLVPPQQWSASKDEGTALLRQVELLMRGNLATPRPFQDLVAQPPDPRPYELDYLSQAAADAVPDRFIAPARDQGHRISELMRALVEVPEADPTPRQFLDPLRDDLIRALSLSDRRTGDATQADTFAQRRVDQTTRAMDNMYRSVTVLPPGGVYTLASEQSPLLLVARNDLPVSIRIKFRIQAPHEAKITDLQEQQLPAKGTRSFQIPTEVSDSRNLVIPISLTTPDGIPLGNATSVSVRSNAYGQALAIITACAGVLLFLLAGRRLWRRFRGQPDPADEGFDPGTRRRVNRYLRAKKRVIQQEHQEAQ